MRLGAATGVADAPLFSARRLTTLGVDAREVTTTSPECGDDEQSPPAPIQTAMSGPWQAAAAKLVELSARPAIERTMVTPGVVLLDNKDGIFSLVGPSG